MQLVSTKVKILAIICIIPILIWISPALFEMLVDPYEGDFINNPAARAISHLRQIEKKLHRWTIPSDIPEFGKTMNLMGISQIATGLLNLHFSQINSKQLASISEVLVKLVNDPKLKFEGMEKDKILGGYGVYYGHRLLTLCAHQLITGKKDFEKDIDSSTIYLAKESARSENHYIVEPYSPNLTKTVFPADQSAVLLALYLCDRVRGTSLHQGVFQAFVKEQQTHSTYKKFGLHPSGWNYLHADIPRGVGMAYEISNIAHIDPELSFKLYQKFRFEMYRSFTIFGGFRERPSQFERKSDLDSGLVIFGIGSAASALALPAAKIFHDEKVYPDLHRLGALLGGIYFWNGERKYFLLTMKDVLSNFLGRNSPQTNAFFFFFCFLCGIISILISNY
jgi:hypothetical protein